MAAKNRLTVEFLRQVLEYRDGKLYWRERSTELFTQDRICAMWNTRWAGQEAGHLVQPDKHGYQDHVIQIGDKNYRRADLTWAIVKGEWPSNTVDHINRNSTDDNIENLRLATQSQNLANASLRKDNKTGFKGVSLHRQTGKYKATIQVNKN